MTLIFINPTLVVKNNSNNKAVKVLGMKINPGQSVDLFKSIEGLAEDRVIAATQGPNGEIFKREKRGIISILKSSFNTFKNDPDIDNLFKVQMQSAVDIDSDNKSVSFRMLDAEASSATSRRFSTRRSLS